MNLGYCKKNGSVYVYFKLSEIQNAHEYFSIVRELEEKDGNSIPLLGDIICIDDSSGMFCFEFAFKDREFITRFLEIMIEAYKMEGPMEEINKLESTLNYINFSQYSKQLN